MIYVHVQPGRIAQNVQEGTDLPVVMLVDDQGQRIVECHGVDILDERGQVVAVLESDMSSTPRVTPHAWLAVHGAYRVRRRLSCPEE